MVWAPVVGTFIGSQQAKFYYTVNGAFEGFDDDLKLDHIPFDIKGIDITGTGEAREY